MIKLRIYGCPDKKHRGRLRRCAFFYISVLMPRKKVLDVKIFFVKDLMKNDGMVGSCVPTDELNKNHREFCINLDTDLPHYDQLSILAHEMTHVRQFATGQLRYDKKCATKSIWNGRIYNDNKIKYENCPWEIDAVKGETMLISQLLKTNLWNDTAWPT